MLSTLDHKSVPWSGRDASVKKDSLAAAAWTIVAELGISVLDAAANQQQLEKLAEIILSRAQPVESIDEFSTPVALAHILSTAETWELPNLRSALLKALVGASASKGSATGVFTVLTACPAQWLSKGARNQLLTAAYQLDADLKGQERAVVRSWLARLASVTMTPSRRWTRRPMDVRRRRLLFSSSRSRTSSSSSVPTRSRSRSSSSRRRRTRPRASRRGAPCRRF